jgi:hypothetical protein
VAGLSSDVINNLQLEIQTEDDDFTATAAQAFMQAFYPPFALANASAASLDSLAVMANNSLVDYPLQGYQYPVIETLSPYDPQIIYVDGSENCLNYDISSNLYYNSTDFFNIENASGSLYQTLGNAFPSSMLSLSDWSYGNAYWVYDYLSYLNRHNTTANSMLADNGPLAGALSRATALANGKEWTLYGDLDIYGTVPGDDILAIAGRTLAAKVLGQFITNLSTLGLVNKVTLLVGEFQPMLSLISLLGLGNTNSRFQSIPPFGSAIVFELFTWNTSAAAGVAPDPSELWVRFLFRNGSDLLSSDISAVNPPIQAYPMFGGDPASTDMPFTDFETAINNIMLNQVQDWCTLCLAETIFCSAFSQSDGSTGSGSAKRPLSPAVAGVIGAIVTLVVIALVACLALYGRRLPCHRRVKRSPLGGFKGSSKLASDADLSNIPQNAAPIGILAAGGAADDKKNHERVGSWELKGAHKDEEAGAPVTGAKHDRYASLGSTIVDRPSYEGDDLGFDIHSAPVRPRESI